MADSRCSFDPEHDCAGIKRANEVAGDVRSLEQRLTEFQHSVGDTTARFGGRIGKLEAHNEVQDEQVKQIKEVQAEIRKEVEEARKEQKDSISELRLEHKESMNELKRSNKEILDAVTPMRHKVEDIDRLTEDMEKLKAKPGETWENIKGKVIGWAVALVLAIVAAALGLSKFL